MLISNFYIFCNNLQEYQSLKIDDKLFILFIFHFDISGKIFKDEHLENKSLISVTLLVSNFEIFSIDINELHSENISYINSTLEVLKLYKFNDINELHPENIDAISLTLKVLKLDKSNDFNELHPENI